MRRAKTLALAGLCVLACWSTAAAQVSRSIQYSYDSLNRLVEVRYPDRLARYTYDPAGNRLLLVVEVPNPVPVVSGISPTAAVVGANGFTLQVAGTQFVAGSVVQWNGSARPTTFISPTALSATIAGADLTAAGAVAITVMNPSPGGGLSHEIPFTIDATAATPTITWANPASIVFGTALSAAQLNATASEAGAFVYSPPAGTVLNAGSGQVLSVTFTPTDTVNHTTATRTATIDVAKATPVVTWANPAATTAGTALTATQLNATADVAGAFVYTPPTGTVLNVGTGQILSVSFTPTDTANYAAATKTVLIDVVATLPAIASFSPTSGVIGSTVSLTGTGFTGTTAVTFNGVPAAYNVVSDTQITTTVPAGTITGPIAVTTSGGTSVSATDFDVTNQRATRTLPTCYAPGYALTVMLDLGPAPEVLAHALDEQPPAGWTRGAVSHDGVWDAPTSKLKWGPFNDAVARSMTYELTPPADASGAVTFAGVVRFDGVEVPVGGATTLARCEQHPADANGDWRLVISDVTGYGAAWKKGNTWAAPPVPIPIGYVTRAGYLWRMGETYQRDEVACPVCWAPLAAVPLPLPDAILLLDDIPTPRSGPLVTRRRPADSWGLASVNLLHVRLRPDSTTVPLSRAGVATRQIPATYTPKVPLTVAIEVAPHGDVQARAVEDAVPAAWRVSVASADGHWDETASVVRWGPFFDADARTLHYTLTSPADARGPQEL